MIAVRDALPFTVPPVRRRLRQRPAVWLIAGLFLLAVPVTLATLQLLEARQHLLRGLSDLRAVARVVNERLVNGGFLGDKATRKTLSDAEQEFASARSDLAFWSPLLTRLDWVPGIGGQLNAAPAATDAALYTTRSTGHLMHGLAPLQPIAIHRNNGMTFSVRIARTLLAGHAQYLAALADANRAAVALRRVPSHTGNPTLDAARARLQTALPTLRTTAAWLASAPLILGLQGASRYLIVLQNPAELRATGGFIGAADFVTIRHGTVRSSFTGSALPHEITTVVPPLPESVYAPEAYWIFRDSNWSPDFPLSARLERWFYGKDTGRWANGVIDIVDSAIGKILGATGPVYVAAFDRWVGAGNVDTLARHYVNGEYHGPSKTGPGDTPRKQFLGDVMTAVLQRIQSLPMDRWAALGNALAGAADRRDIMVYDSRPRVESLIHSSGLDGSLTIVPGDFLSIVDDNRSYNKINPYVQEQAAYRASVQPDHSIRATLSITYYVAPSPANLEGAGPGYGSWGSKHDYQDFLRVYVPPAAHLASMSGLDPWAPAPAYGLTQFAGRLLVRQGQTHTVIIRYTLPPSVASDRYTLTVRRQPGSTLPAIRISIQSGRDAVNRTLALDRDTHLDLPLQGTLHPQPAVTPRTQAPIDPYIPFRYLHDPAHPL